MGDLKTQPIIVINTEYGPVKVRKMPLADYGQLLTAINKLPEALGKLYEGDANFEEMETPQLLKLVLPALAGAWADVAAIIAVPTDKDEAFMLQLDGADAFDVIAGILELNDFARIWASIKKMRALKTPEKRPEPGPENPPKAT